MGGHGYSAYNAIAPQIMDHGVITTGGALILLYTAFLLKHTSITIVTMINLIIGGDNIVLAQQSARQLLSALQKALRYYCSSNF